MQILPDNHCMTVKSQPPKSQELHNVVTFSAYMTQKNRVTEGRTLVTQVNKKKQKSLPSINFFNKVEIY